MNDVISCMPLSGGVSSDIKRVQIGEREICTKRVLARLKTKQEWRAPVRRIAKEAAFFSAVGEIEGASVPTLLGFDQATGLIAMPYYPGSDYAVWKHALRDGTATARQAGAVGKSLAVIHAATHGDQKVREQFYDPELIRALRLEPYFVSTAGVHVDLETTLHGLCELFESNCETLIHGDFSPKNILMGEDGPILLDAECANYGDPAFDVAFCLNHLCLKAVWRPAHLGLYQNSFAACLEGYASGYSDASVLARAAKYLPGLMLARIDGTSPAEYITTAASRDLVRRFAITWLTSKAPDLNEMAANWYETILANPEIAA